MLYTVKASVIDSLYVCTVPGWLVVLVVSKSRLHVSNIRFFGTFVAAVELMPGFLRVAAVVTLAEAGRRRKGAESPPPCPAAFGLKDAGTADPGRLDLMNVRRREYCGCTVAATAAEDGRRVPAAKGPRLTAAEVLGTADIGRGWDLREKKFS